MTRINVLREKDKGVQLNVGSVTARQRPQTRTNSLIGNNRPKAVIDYAKFS